MTVFFAGSLQTRGNSSINSTPGRTAKKVITRSGHNNLHNRGAGNREARGLKGERSFARRRGTPEEGTDMVFTIEKKKQIPKTVKGGRSL